MKATTPRWHGFVNKATIAIIAFWAVYMSLHIIIAIIKAL